MMSGSVTLRRWDRQGSQLDNQPVEGHLILKIMCVVKFREVTGTRETGMQEKDEWW